MNEKEKKLFRLDDAEMLLGSENQSLKFIIKEMRRLAKTKEEIEAYFE